MPRRRITTVALTTALVTVLGVAATAGPAAAGTGTTPVRLSGPSPYPVGCDHRPPAGTLHQDAEVQPHVAADPRDPRHLLAVWQQDRWSGVGAHGLVTAATVDGGVHWSTATPAVSTCAGGEFWRATDSQVSIGRDGTAYLASLSLNTAVASGENAIQLARSTDGGRHWQPPVTVIREGTDPNRFVFNDLPSVTADPTDDRYAYAVWDRIVDPPLAGPLYLTRSTDHGRTWQPPAPVYDPGLAKVAEGAKIIVRPDGSLVAVFAVAVFDPATEQQLSQSYQAIRSTDKGRTWSAPSTVAQDAVAGTTAGGTVLRDGGGIEAQAATGPDGTLFVVWQDNRFSADRHTDGIALARSTDGGRTWSTPRRVNPDPRVQAFSPSIAVTRAGVLGVSYSRLTTGTNAENRVATSRDGTHWRDRPVTPPFDLATAPTVDAPAGARYLGDYHGMAAAGDRLVTVFATPTGRPENPTDVYAAISTG